MPLLRLTSNVFVQDETAILCDAREISWSEISAEPAGNVSRISHVVNWFKGDATVEAIQSASARSMELAARSHVGGNAVRLIACLACNETDILPPGFVACRPLTRTVLDCATFRTPRHLSILFDILDRGMESAYQDGFLVLTNADICLQPHFYRSIFSFLSRGIDCLIVNRRTVQPLQRYEGFEDFASIETGTCHPGLDCFVFPVAWGRNFVRGNACVGAGWVMRSLLYNLVANARRMLILRSAHLTYHYGDDRPWADPRFEDYSAFNLEQARLTLASLCGAAQQRQLLSEFCTAHAEPLRPNNQG